MRRDSLKVGKSSQSSEYFVSSSRGLGDERGMFALYCVAGLIILSLLILMIVFIYRKNKNKQSSATSSEFSNSDDQLNLTTQSPTFDPPPTTFQSFNPFEVPESEE